MTNDQSERKTPEDAGLDRLIRAARKDPEEGFVRPEAETITAYVLGTANEDQRAEIRAALARSGAFRREILEMMEDVAALAHEDPLADEERAKGIAVPDVRELLRQPGGPAITGTRRESTWGRFWRWWAPRLAVPVAAAAVVIYVLILHTGTFVRSDLRFVQQVDAHSLSFRTRGVDEQSRAWGTAFDAALVEIKSLLEPEGDEQFRLKPQARSEGFTYETRVVTVRLVPAAGEMASFDLRIPKEIDLSESRLTLWVLTLPSRNLYSADVTSNRVEIPWARDAERQGCLTIAYPVDGKYRATDGLTFDLK
jgi:hypothetical protein